MRYASFAFSVFVALLAILLAAPRHAYAAMFTSRAAVIEWIDSYRNKPEPSRLPAAVKALSESGALREPDTAGYYVGFAAGVLGANPKDAARLVAKMLPLPASDQWLVVRALAYSGLPTWKAILARAATAIPARQDMIDAYLSGSLPALDQLELDKSPTTLETIKQHLGMGVKPAAISFGRNPELLDTLWGEYFAAGQYSPIWRIITMLPWSKERDSIERLTIGSSAKYTLANNAARYPDILALIKSMAPYQPQDVKPILTEVIHAAETVETSTIRKEQLAAIDRLKTKGSGTQHDMTLWGYVGQGAVGITCVTLAALSVGVAGIPCVIGGAATSAALTYWAAQ